MVAWILGIQMPFARKSECVVLAGSKNFDIFRKLDDSAAPGLK